MPLRFDHVSMLDSGTVLWCIPLRGGALVMCSFNLALLIAFDGILWAQVLQTSASSFYFLVEPLQADDLTMGDDR
jgi:hypothetical protein